MLKGILVSDLICFKIETKAIEKTVIEAITPIV
jgi:hypothetical protein